MEMEGREGQGNQGKEEIDYNVSDPLCHGGMAGDRTGPGSERVIGDTVPNGDSKTMLQI